MTPKDLLMPRFKVIADYPKMPFTLNQILELKPAAYEKAFEYRWAGHDGIYSEYESFFNDYPHLFKPLEWWEERNIEDMPMYIKIKEGGNIVRVREWNIGDDYIKYTYAYFDPTSSCEVSHCIPATEQEYIEFTKK